MKTLIAIALVGAIGSASSTVSASTVSLAGDPWTRIDSSAPLAGDPWTRIDSSAPLSGDPWTRIAGSAP